MKFGHGNKLNQNSKSDDRIRILKDFDIEIPDRRIYHRLGYKTGPAAVTETVRRMVAEQKNLLPELIRPGALFRILDYRDTNRHPIFEGADKVALCVCTIGPELERKSQEQIADNQMLNGFILDSLGSEAAEEVARLSDRIIAEEARSAGFWPSKRFSPGYGAWDIREQQYVFQVLPADRIGVSLSETCMMNPRKSVSFRINLYTDRNLSTRRFG